MAPPPETEPLFPTIEDALDTLTVGDLKTLLSLLTRRAKPTRKADLVAAVAGHLRGEALQAVWDRLDATQQQAVVAAAYTADGIFDSARFHARYGVLPGFTTGEGGLFDRGDPTVLRLFFYKTGRFGAGDDVLPGTLQQWVRERFAEPAGPSLVTVAAPPETLPAGSPWRDDADRTPVHRHHGEAALSELAAVLRLVEQGRVPVSEKTGLPGAAVLRALEPLLGDGDFYPPEARGPYGDAPVGAIRAFAWPLLLQAGGLAERHGKRLTLTRAGHKALNRPAAETLRRLWQRWVKSRLFDELNRVDAIKGQRGKGKRTLTAPASRRQAIEAGLCECPADTWVELEGFSRYLLAAGHEFEVSRDPWQLYVEDPHYGSLGYDGCGGWTILQKRYLCVLLFEYAATLGLIDVAYVVPWEAPRDFDELWGTEDLLFLSRYDGLTHFRLTGLGRYCLGLTDRYSLAMEPAATALRVRPNRIVEAVEDPPAPAEALLLDTWAEREDDRTWRLERETVLEAIERGRPLGELREFLAARDPQELPEPVEGFLAGVADQATALRSTGTVLLVECTDDETAERVVGDRQARKLCRRVGPRHLAVRPEDEERFRQAARGLGLGMPRG